ncbi:hypothetical protein PCCS19_07020 [Paenibacillus sp. CCS19]|uniref:aminotransferase yhxA n=1 Tax=Paenibacillus sp. CCS19 TaxID=3158387 RepID=UPI00256067F5|nr:aminotransferase yhxA [Paenibacillus cellulosilyticus]GMK37648.1 hypothetical protein PCCS19_07020 [Paenibacillus cellulosilyticus]
MNNRLTKKVMLSISGAALAATMTGCSQSYPKPSTPPPNDGTCKEWEWNSKDAAYQCDDRGSSHYGSYYYNNRYFTSRSTLRSSSDYQSYKSTLKPKSSGFGKGSSVFGS